MEWTKENRDETKYKKYCQESTKRTKGFLEKYLLDDLSEKVHNVEIEIRSTEIPIWKYGVRLVNREDRDVFDVIRNLAKKQGGRYDKEEDCWVFSRERKREDFIDSICYYQQYPTPPRYTKAEEFMDINNLQFDFDSHMVTAKLKVHFFDGKMYSAKIKNGYITMNYDNLKFIIESLLHELNGWVLSTTPA